MQKIQTSGSARTQGDSKYKERGIVAMSISINSETDKGTARLAQSAERKALNLVVVGSSHTVGVFSKSGGPSIAEEAFLRAMMMKITRKKRTPTVGFEPTYTRLRALRSAD